MEYRYMIWNDFKKEFQFPKICETTEKGATSCLFNFMSISFLNSFNNNVTTPVPSISIISKLDITSWTTEYSFLTIALIKLKIFNEVNP